MLDDVRPRIICAKYFTTILRRGAFILLETPEAFSTFDARPGLHEQRYKVLSRLLLVRTVIAARRAFHHVFFNLFLRVSGVG